jgi:hypothetical protein
VDSPSSIDSLFEESEKNMIFAHKLLKENTNMTIEELEYALGCNGYREAIEFALSPTCWELEGCHVEIVECNNIR